MKRAAIVTAVAPLALMATACGSSSKPSTSAAPTQVVVWRMGASTPAQVTWMDDVIKQFHKQYPQYAKTAVTVKFVPWTVRTTQWQNALSSGKGGPDITEMGNTDTPALASQGMLTDITSNVNSWPNRADFVSGMIANDTQNGKVYAVPWFGGVRGVWYRKDQFAGARISAPPTSWAQLLADANALMKKYPGTYGLGAPSNYTNGLVSFIWGAGGEVAVRQGGKWVAELNSPRSETGIKFYADLYLTQHVSPYTSQLTGGAYASDPIMSGFAKAATNTKISPLNAKNWPTADATDLIIPTMMKDLMNGAPFATTVNKANTQLQNVLNTGSEG